MMKKIKLIRADGFYIFRGEVAANSNFIETLDEAKRFLIYANYFLKEYLIIYEYVITRHEWHMVVKLKASKDICNASKSSDAGDLGENMVWRIVSERVRLFLSNYARSVNRMRGRTGTLVHSSYERYYFETLVEAKSVIEQLRAQTLCMYKRKKKYRGIKSHYRIPIRLGKGSIFLCSKDMRMEKNVGWNFLESQYLPDLTDLVLSKMIKFTISNRFSTKTKISLPKIE